MHARFLDMTIKNQQTDENAGHFFNIRRVGQGVKMLCGKTQSGIGGYPNSHKRDE